MRFANDFHSWRNSWLRHSWKLLANRLTRDPKIVIHGNSCIILYIIYTCSAAEIWSPGRQMRPMNPPGYPRSHHRWSVWRPMNSLGNISEWNWSYDFTDIMCPFVLKPKQNMDVDWLIWTIFLIDFMVWADYWLTDHPELRRTIQPSTMGGIFRSTVHEDNWGAFQKRVWALKSKSS